MTDIVSETEGRPWSPEAEQAVLGALLKGAPLDGISLTMGDFCSWQHKIIFDTIKRLASRHQTIDILTVWEAAKDDGRTEDVGSLEYLSVLANAVYSTRNLGAHAARVREMAKRRELLEKAETALEIAWDPAGDTATKVDQITSLFAGLQREQTRKVPRSLAEIALERTEHYEALERGEVAAGMPTHIPALDRFLNGGLRPGGLYIVAARPGVGKSSVSQSITMEIARDGHRVLFLSQEMAETEVADRAVSSRGQIPYDALLSGQMDRQHWARAVDVLSAADLADFFVDDQPALTLLDVRSKAKQVPGLKVLVLDYLQLCGGSGGKEANRNSEIEQISRGLKTLAKELGIAVIALSQLNRQVELRTSKRPMLADLRDSGSIEQDADVVALMWPARDLGQGARLIGLELAKNRQGRQGSTVALHFDGATQRWAESTESLTPLQPMPSAARRGFSEVD